MKIGIESQRIFRSSKHGMDVVALELIRKIQLLDTTNQYLLFAKNGDDRGCISDTVNFKTQVVGGLSYADWEQISLPGAVNRSGVELLHCTANTAPFRCAVPMIVTVHDIIYLEDTNFKGSAYQNFGNLYRKFVVPKAIANAKKIITVSEYEKKVIVDVCKVDPEKIVVIYNGVSERFHDRFSREELTTFSDKFNLPGRFILFLGNTAPKKNTEGALKAYAAYCKNTDDPANLVVTDLSADAIRAILEKYKQSELMDNIVATGYVPSSQMPLLYNCASLFLYPSLRESFGLPVIEAMGCGKPVVASDIAPLREVAGDAAVFVNPEQPQQIAQNIFNVLSNPHLQQSLIEKGKERIKLFNWENSAKQLIELYKRTV